MNNDKKVVSVGTVSVFLVMIVLVFVTFSLLSLTLASSDLKLSTKSLSATSDYYKADSLAQKRIYNSITLAERNGISAAAKSINETDFPCSSSDNSLLLSFSVPVNDKLCLYVEADVLFSDGAASKIDILRWQCAAKNE